MRPPRVLFVCLCVVLAGCGGVASPNGSDTRTVNPALGETPTTSPTPERWDGPPGVTDSDVRVSVLVAAHEDALQDRSVVVRSNTTVTRANGTVVERSRLRSVARADRQYFTYQLPVFPYTFPDSNPPNRSVWRNETVAVLRQPSTDGDAETAVHTPPYPREVEFDPSGSDVLDRVLGGLELTYAGGTVLDGERVHVLTAADVDQPALPAHSNLRVDAFVTDAGVVRSLAIRYRVPQYAGVDRPATVEVHFRTATSADGIVSVPRPAWVNSTLANATAPTSD